jgi:hypothetical protein
MVSGSLPTVAVFWTTPLLFLATSCHPPADSLFA